MQRNFLLKMDTTDPSMIEAWDKLMLSDDLDISKKYASYYGNISRKFFCKLNKKENNILLSMIGMNGISIETSKTFIIEILFDVIKKNWKGWTEDQEMNYRAKKSIIRCLDRDISIEEIEDGN